MIWRNLFLIWVAMIVGYLVADWAGVFAALIGINLGALLKQED